MSSGDFDSNSESVAAVTAVGTLGADGVDASSDTGNAITAISSNTTDPGSDTGGAAVFAQAFAGVGVHAISGGFFTTSGLPEAGILAESAQGPGVFATNGGSSGTPIPADAAVHAVSAGTPASPGPQGFGDLQTAMFAEGGVGRGLIATAGPTGAQLTTGPDSDPETWSGIGNSILAQNFYGSAIAATSYFGTAVNASIASLEDVDPPPPLGTSPLPVPGICILAVNENSQLAMLAASQGDQDNPSDCIKASTGFGAGIVGSTGGLVVGSANAGVYGATLAADGTGVMGTTRSVGGTGVTADGGTTPDGQPIGGVALQVQNGTIAVKGNSVGSVTIAKGTQTLTVNNAAATANSLIFLTPLGNPQAFLWIGNHSAGSFTIEASTALPAAVTIGFLIMN